MLRILFSYFTLDVLLHVVSAMDMSKSKYVEEMSSCGLERSRRLLSI